MQAQFPRPLNHLLTLITLTLPVHLALGFYLSPAGAQASPQEVDNAMGKINQTLTQPAKLLAPEKPAKPIIQSGQVRVEDRPKSGELDPTPVTLNEEPVPATENTLTDVLKASVTKTETLPITLDAVLKLVEEQSLPVQVNHLASRIQKTAVYKSVSDMLPDIGGSYDQSRFNGGMQIFGDQVMRFKRVQFVPQVMARWTIRPGGEDIFKMLAAKRRYAGSKSLLQSTLQEQLAGAAQDYYNLIEAQTQVENIRIAINEAKSQVELNESRLKAGVGTKLDVMRAKSQLVQRERDLIAAESHRAKMEQALLNRLNLDPDVSLSTEGELVQPHLLVPLTYTTDALVEIGKANNPALAQLQAEIKALKAEAAAVLSRIVPSVTLQTYVQGTGPELQNLVRGTFIGLNLQSGLFEGLGTSIPVDYKAKQLQIKQKELELQALQRTTEQQVIQAYLDSRQAAKSILTAWQELEVAEEAYRLAVGRFRAGLGINVDVLDAQTALSTARASVTQATLAFNRAQVGLLQALGQVSKDSILN
ncbi:MAG TPA: TolC family protein, partial [Oculatellaceae cyanobacterium]